MPYSGSRLSENGLNDTMISVIERILFIVYDFWQQECFAVLSVYFLLICNYCANLAKKNRKKKY